jgi:polyhydroxyalkanoate synthesis repressor PhaR
MGRSKDGSRPPDGAMAEQQTTTKDPAKPPTVIKKYANRRLYHTGTSAYVTLEDLASMLKAGDEFVVTDAKTGEDITRSVLTQIIFEQESKGQNLLPIAFLRQLIRFYGDSLQGVVPGYLDMSMQNFAKEQERFRSQMAEAFGAPFAVYEEQVRQNMAMFESAMRMFTPFAPGAEPHAPPKGGAPAAPRPADEIDSLKGQIDEMRRKLDELAKKTS